jgi:exodeoxyribonuclease VII large subunit
MPDSPMKLSDLTGLIRETLQNRFARESYWVLADVSDHKFYPQKRHHYFELVEKDEAGGNLLTKVSAVAWLDGGRSIDVFEKETGQRFTTGIHVLVRVKVDYSALYGLKLILLEVDTRFTLGELEKKKQETIRRLLLECTDYIRLAGEKIITRNHGHPFKLALQRIAVLSSRQSAGYQDFVHTLHQNSYGYEFLVDTYHASVQGEEKAKDVLEQLINIFRSGKPYDVVVIIRGGGSESDFLIFNDFNLSRAIAKFPIPIITGIGHLKDQSIADLMAHTETKTPTKAAEYIIAHNRVFEDQLLELRKNILIKAQQVVSNRQKWLTNLNSIVVNKSRDYIQRYSLEMARFNRVVTQVSMQIVHTRKNEMVSLSGRIIAEPKITVGKRLHELVQIGNNLATFRSQFLKTQHAYLNHYISLVKLASPEHTMKRGFALVKKNEVVITNAGQISVGDDIVVVLDQTELKSTVKEKIKMNGSENNI